MYPNAPEYRVDCALLGYLHSGTYDGGGGIDGGVGGGHTGVGVGVGVDGPPGGCGGPAGPGGPGVGRSGCGVG